MIDELRRTLPMDAIAALFRQYQVRGLSVFGSALREDFGEHSDIDLLVLFEPGARIGWEYFRLERELSALAGRKVDLVEKDGLRPLIRDEVLSQAQVLYAA